MRSAVIWEWYSSILILFNNLTVLDNITLAPIKLKIMTKKEAEAEAMRLLKLVNLEEKANAYPAQLSGGQKQRIALYVPLP